MKRYSNGEKKSWKRSRRRRGTIWKEEQETLHNEEDCKDEKDNKEKKSWKRSKRRRGTRQKE